MSVSHFLYEYIANKIANSKASPEVELRMGALHFPKEKLPISVYEVSKQSPLIIQASSGIHSKYLSGITEQFREFKTSFKPNIEEK